MPVRRRVVAVLLALAAGVAALTVAVGVQRRPDIAAPAAGLAVAAAGHVIVRTAPGLLTSVVFGVFSAAHGRRRQSPLGAAMLVPIGGGLVVADM